ncbi:hypothetical protein [Bordetella sp. 2513F-2]
MEKDDTVVQFPRAPRRDDDVLATLNGALSQASPTVDEAARIHQHAEGTSHIQAGRDINVYGASTFPENGDFIACPACHQPVGRYADTCLHCGNNVRRHYLALHQQRVQRRAMYIAAPAAVVLFSGLLLHQLGWIPDVWSGDAAVVMGVAALIGLAASRLLR